MSDITKCNSRDCPLKENCYRYKAPASEYRQSYFVTPPYNSKTKGCEYLWK